MNSNVVRLAPSNQQPELLESIESYLADADLAASSVKVYERTLEALVDQLGSDASLDSVSRAILAKFLNNRYGHTQPTTFNRNLATIGSFFTWCEDHELVPVSPARKLKPRKVRISRETERQQRPIPFEQLKALWTDTRHDLRERCYWVMLYETAARAEELLSINVEHLDTANKDAVVIGKGGNAERVYWASPTARLLPRLIGDRNQGPLFLTHRQPGSHVLPAAADTCPTTGRARLSYRRAAELFNEATDGKTLHQLRHSALTHLAEQGEPLTRLKAKSRHSSIRSLERYVAPGPASLREMTDKHDTNRR